MGFSKAEKKLGTESPRLFQPYLFDYVKASNLKNQKKLWLVLVSLRGKGLSTFCEDRSLGMLRAPRWWSNCVPSYKC